MNSLFEYLVGKVLFISFLCWFYDFSFQVIVGLVNAIHAPRYLNCYNFNYVWRSDCRKRS